MKRLLYTLILLVAGTCCAAAADPFADLAGNFDRSASNHHAYPVTDDNAPSLTAAPAGYEAFYISHYGRHGSRWLTRQAAYDQPVDDLMAARRARQLTPQGEQLLKSLRAIADEADRRAGDLSDVGAEQHRGIMRRMVKNFPAVFGPGAAVDARSTVVLRCLLSMQNATMTLRGLRPHLPVTVDASYADQHYMGYGRGEDTLAIHIKHEMDSMNRRLEAAELRPQRFIAQLVVDTAWAAEHLDGRRLMKSVFDIAGSLQNHHSADRLSLYHYFTEQEIDDLWRMKNRYWYCRSANAPQNGNRLPFIQRALLRRMIADADSVIARGQRGASLRYGHESCLIPLACLMELDSINYSCDDLTVLHEHWQDYRLYPMACNIQVVYYRPAGRTACEAREVLVKVLFNEHEALLPVDRGRAPYYRWSDLRDYYLDKLDRPIDWAAPSPGLRQE